MIRIGITETGMRMEGHAGYHRNGRDLVCAAVSALTCALNNSLWELEGINARSKTASGDVQMEWGELTDRGKLLVDSWFLGIAAINQEYNCIKYV